MLCSPRIKTAFSGDKGHLHDNAKLTGDDMLKVDSQTLSPTSTPHMSSTVTLQSICSDRCSQPCPSECTNYSTNKTRWRQPLKAIFCLSFALFILEKTEEVVNGVYICKCFLWDMLSTHTTVPVIQVDYHYLKSSCQFLSFIIFFIISILVIF